MYRLSFGKVSHRQKKRAFTYGCQLDSQPQTPFRPRSCMAREFQRSLVFVDEITLKEISGEIELGPCQPSHHKVLWELSTGATHLLRELCAFKAGFDDT